MLRPDDGRVIALDTLHEGVHFDLAWSSPADAAFKAIAVNASDLWAMGAEPRAWLLSLGLAPDRASVELVDELASGFADAIRELGLTIDLVGGDTVRSSGGLALSVTMIGACDGEPLTRDGVRPGDGLYVDGPLGLAAAGMAVLEAGATGEGFGQLVQAHRRPVPRRLLAKAARAAGIRAAIDVSDGLVRDAGRLGSASGVGLEIASELPGAALLEPAAIELGDDLRQWQLHGGDDYVRLVAAPTSPGPGWSLVGRAIDGPPGVWSRGPDGRTIPLAAAGFEHFGAAP